MADPLEEQQASAASAEAAESSLLDQIVAETKLKPADEGYDKTRQGVSALIAELAKSSKVEKLDGKVVDAMISELDRKLSLQLDEILHHPEVQKLESAWRGLKFVVDRTNFRENIKIEILNVSKDDLQTDFEDSPEIVKSGLYKHVYTAEYGQFGGNPVGAMIANYDFGPGPKDMALLTQCAAVAAMSHAPFIAAASPKFFGVEDYTTLPNLKDLKSIFAPLWVGARSSEMKACTPLRATS